MRRPDLVPGRRLHDARSIRSCAQAGWTGYWIDAASTLRMADDAVIILDPVNREVIDARARAAASADFIGGNCTVSLMLMAMAGLFRAGLVEWMTAMTYQAASGAGAQHMRELIDADGRGARVASRRCSPTPRPPSSTSIAPSSETLRRRDFPTRALRLSRSPAACCPGSTRISATARAAKSGRPRRRATRSSGATRIPIPVDGICVRIGAMRCHSQALTIKLRRDVPLARDRVAARLRARVGARRPEREGASLRELTPAAVTGTLKVPIGRLRKLAMGGEYLGAFTVGDQLLWGAAEPLRRMLRILQSAGIASSSTPATARA